MLNITWMDLWQNCKCESFEAHKTDGTASLLHYINFFSAGRGTKDHQRLLTDTFLEFDDPQCLVTAYIRYCMGPKLGNKKTRLFQNCCHFSVTMLISEKWQQFWNSCTNKLQAIRPTVGNGHQPKPSLSRRDEVVVNRLRIGHTRCTHSYLLTGADQPECTTCQCPLTVKHILVDCLNFNDTRNKHFVASSMEELFRTADVHTSLILQKKLILKQVMMFTNISIVAI